MVTSAGNRIRQIKGGEPEARSGWYGFLTPWKCQCKKREITSLEPTTLDILKKDPLNRGSKQLVNWKVMTRNASPTGRSLISVILRGYRREDRDHSYATKDSVVRGGEVQGAPT